MQKTTYGILSIITLTLLGYTTFTAYTAYNESQTITPVVITPSPETATTTPEKILTTSTGKTITLLETNPLGESMSTIKLTPSGFFLNDTMTLEKNKLTSYFLKDINKDGFDELVLITTVQGSGSYGDVVIFTTAKDNGLALVTVPQLKEEAMQPGALFEGYMGHDTFKLENDILVREYPTYNASDTNDKPTGLSKKLIYTLIDTNGSYSVKITKEGATSSPVSNGSTTELFGSSWIWQAGIFSGKMSTVPTGEKFVLTFNKDKSITSTTDCNTLNSGTLLSGTSTLKFGQISSTKKACQKSQEAEYIKLLAEVTSYSINGNLLTLALGTKGTMTFKHK